MKPFNYSLSHHLWIIMIASHTQQHSSDWGWHTLSSLLFLSLGRKKMSGQASLSMPPSAPTDAGGWLKVGWLVNGLLGGEWSQPVHRNIAEPFKTPVSVYKWGRLWIGFDYSASCDCWSFLYYPSKNDGSSSEVLSLPRWAVVLVVREMEMFNLSARHHGVMSASYITLSIPRGIRPLRRERLHWNEALPLCGGIWRNGCLILLTQTHGSTQTQPLLACCIHLHSAPAVRLKMTN